MSVYAKKSFDKIQYVFVIFKCNETVLEGYFLNMMK